MLLLTFPRAVLGLHAGATTLQSVSVYFLVAACAKWNIPFRQGHDEVEMVYTIHIIGGGGREYDSIPGGGRHSYERQTTTIPEHPMLNQSHRAGGFLKNEGNTPSF